jgi:hypothetical protein
MKHLSHTPRDNGVESVFPALSKSQMPRRALADGVLRGYHQLLEFREQLAGTAALVVEFHLLTLAELNAPQILTGEYRARFEWLLTIQVETPSKWYETGTTLDCRTPLRRGNMETFRDDLLRKGVDTTITLPHVKDAEIRAAKAACSD